MHPTIYCTSRLLCLSLNSLLLIRHHVSWHSHSHGFIRSHSSGSTSFYPFGWCQLLLIKFIVSWFSNSISSCSSVHPVMLIQSQPFIFMLIIIILEYECRLWFIHVPTNDTVSCVHAAIRLNMRLVNKSIHQRHQFRYLTLSFKV